MEVLQDFTVVTHHLGTPFMVDAAQCGSYAHRLRNYWTNLAPLSVLQHSLHGTVRDPHRLVQDILDEDSSPRPVTAQESPPYYAANVIGSSRAVWPTLLSFTGSHAFCDDGPGMVYRHRTGQWEEPSPEEQERVMGFQSGTTAHPSLSRHVRNRLMGQVMDLHCLICVITTCLALQMLAPSSLRLPVPTAPLSTSQDEPDLVVHAVDGVYHFMPTVEGGEAPCMPSNRGTLVDAFSGLEMRPSHNCPTATTFEWTMGSQLVEER